MTISMRELFERQEIVNEVISFRYSLENHPNGVNTSLREANSQFRKLARDDGYSRGCMRKDAVDKLIGGKSPNLVLPSWAPVSGQTRLVRSPDGNVKLEIDYSGETRTVEGILTNSKIADEDFPFASWHKYYDWNLDVRPDQQYRYLLNNSNLDKHKGVIECEWDSAHFPQWAWPQVGDRVWIVGRWIYDCGHPDEKNRHKTEIHPPKAIASFRTESVKFRENHSPTRANVALLFIGRDGGYWRQPINNQDYSLDLYLPPKPYAEATPVWTVESKTGNLPVQPRISPFPSNEPKALRVTIPLKGVTPHPESYGAIIAGGWSDPRNTEGAKVKRFRVTVSKLRLSGDEGYDIPPGIHVDDPFEYYLYVGINGRWRIWKSLSGDTDLNYSVELHLHASDQIHITSCGFEADEIHDLMGKNIGTTWDSISDPAQKLDNVARISSGFLSLGTSLDFNPLSDANIQNETIGIVSKLHSPRKLGLVTVSSSKQDYKLQYKIDEI